MIKVRKGLKIFQTAEPDLVGVWELLCSNDTEKTAFNWEETVSAINDKNYYGQECRYIQQVQFKFLHHFLQMIGPIV